jgi:hypothetical protein
MCGITPGGRRQPPVVTRGQVGRIDTPRSYASRWGMGWFVTCTDPHGNEFGLWQNDEKAPMLG